ncbi:hypothetical protein MSPP1_000371 [Malassezia sp. CBS 17886]|nr:hypothetical protein MSPP1_000371 [Malassezia sp. CBS 17886]
MSVTRALQRVPMAPPLPQMPCVGRASLASVRTYSDYVRSDEYAAQPATLDQAPSAGPIPIRYPYFVPRVGINATNLPVYTKVRHGGHSWQTIVRKVDGDVAALCRDLFEDFGWGDQHKHQHDAEPTVVRMSTQAGPKTIVLRGNCSRDIKQWLEQRGF